MFSQIICIFQSHWIIQMTWITDLHTASQSITKSEQKIGSVSIFFNYILILKFIFTKMFNWIFSVFTISQKSLYWQYKLLFHHYLLLLFPSSIAFMKSELTKTTLNNLQMKYTWLRCFLISTPTTCYHALFRKSFLNLKELVLNSPLASAIDTLSKSLFFWQLGTLLPIQIYSLPVYVHYLC